MAQDNLLQIYKRFDITLSKGDGVYLFDTKGKKYLDFASGIGVCALGYRHKTYTQDLHKQIDKILHSSNLFYNENIEKATQNLSNASGLEKVFFVNSGTEAMEGAFKVAKKFAYKKNIKNPQFIAFKNSFHGRTLGALSLTANEKYQKPFKPLIQGVKFAKFNDIESVKKLINKKTVAIIIETVQGEGGITVAEKTFFQALRKLCDENDILLIADEIQCGMGRSGKFFVYQYFDVLPDVLASAKALGCGISVGAFVLGKKVTSILELGDHGTTYGGNPLACAAVNAVFKAYKEDDILANVKKLGIYFEEKLDMFAKKYSFVKKRQGIGFMQSLSLKSDVKVADVIKKAQENSLLIISCGKNDLRFLPPLIITKEHINEMFHKLDSSLSEF
ncbi:aspartate aminotransferase family protein [uncultured Campylobacter sp.]|uniref:aspartate aminotransferase family protein n=1 Tax=uncultured Campylobacter sp. TaxID=218934 RepID=UPI002638C3DC|nr:aspartate aminotransferase family protein [uncultured Campylobacter sp.]